MAILESSFVDCIGSLIAALGDYQVRAEVVGGRTEFSKGELGESRVSVGSRWQVEVVGGGCRMIDVWIMSVV